jgi:hypothetical protein
VYVDCDTGCVVAGCVDNARFSWVHFEAHIPYLHCWDVWK